jgi:signal transduction histidine kinase
VRFFSVLSHDLKSPIFAVDGFSDLLMSDYLEKLDEDLREVIEEVILKYNFQIEEGGVRVVLPDELPVVNVDPEKIREALGVLLSNALFFTDRPKGESEIVIESTAEAERVRICIRDNGIGIDPRYVNQVFELGGMSKLDKQRGGGPGYGLYLAKRLIESHGGDLTVESTLEQGSTFCFTIPT